MRKLFWVLAGIMVLAALGNIIGGTDTPVRGSVDPAGGPSVVRADIPAAPRTTILLPIGEKVVPRVASRTRTGSAPDEGVPWIARTFGPVARFPSPALRATSPQRGEEKPAQNQPGYGIVQRQTAASCSSRLYCSQIIARRSSHARKRGGIWPIAVGAGRWMAMGMACRARRFVGRLLAVPQG